MSEQKLPKAVELLVTVSDKIKASGDAVVQKVVAARVEAELQKRADSLEKALVTRASLASEVKKLEKPDVDGTYDADGKEVTPASFSKARAKELKDKRDKLAKVDKLINAALENNEWGKLNEFKG